ncbi:MAG: DNA-processing protein DprA [Epsilonproteobacteria bacterium]|nr:DNA-processing protein DprA [Campylobacterota bacterium]
MIKRIDFQIKELLSMKKYPKKLFYKGDLNLLKRRKVSIVGARKAYPYTREFTLKIAKELSKREVAIVSGAAMGVDREAHIGAGAKNTIAVMGNSLDIRYPAVNRKLIEDIEKNGLVISPFEESFKPTKWSFVVRNEIVVALGEVLIITQADLNSGSMRSADFAIEMKKEIYVLPHRLNESEGTNYLLKNSLAKPILDIEEFASLFGEKKDKRDEFLEFCSKNPSYEEAVKRFKDRVFEAELLGEIEIVNGKIIVL